MSKRKRYELISATCGFGGVIFVMAIMMTFALCIESFKALSIWENLVVIIVMFIPVAVLMVAMVIFSKKAFKIEVEEVKQMHPVLFNKWLNETDDPYVRKVLTEIGGYEHKWVKVDNKHV